MAMTPDTPVFHAKDPNGLSWSFDPATSKWAVQGEGEHSALKASSQKLEVLVAKAIDWSQAQKAPPAPPKESFEVEMLMAGGMSFQDGRALEIKGVRIRLEWDEAAKGYQVSKYRPHEKGQGWRAFRADELFLIDPFDLNPDTAAWLANKYTQEEVGRLFTQTERVLAQQWFERKSVQAKGVTIGRDLQLHDISLEALAARSRMSSQPEAFVLSSQVPLFLQDKNVNVLDLPWNVDSTGRWSLEGKNAWVRMQAPSLRGSATAQFELGLGEGDEAQVLFTSSNFKTALALAKTLTEEKLYDLPAAAEWVGNPLGTGSVYWPMLTETKAYVFLEAKGGDDQMFALMRENPQQRPGKNHRDTKHEWGFKPVSGNKYQSTLSHWSSGEEDVIPMAVAKLEATMLSTKDVLFQQARTLAERVKSDKNEKLSELVGLVTEGEEPRTPEQVQIKWTHVKERMLQRVCQSQTVQEFTQACEQAKQEVEQRLRPATKRPKP
jgi:hypothetical protein